MAKPAAVKLTYEEFTLRAISALRKDGYKGIHTVFSGFNEAFRQYFDRDPVEVTKALADEGKIVLRIAKGGATIYLPEDMPKDLASIDALSKILTGGDGNKKK